MNVGELKVMFFIGGVVAPTRVRRTCSLRYLRARRRHQETEGVMPSPCNRLVADGPSCGSLSFDGIREIPPVRCNRCRHLYNACAVRRSPRTFGFLLARFTRARFADYVADRVPLAVSVLRRSLVVSNEINAFSFDTVRETKPAGVADRFLRVHFKNMYSISLKVNVF